MTRKIRLALVAVVALAASITLPSGVRADDGEPVRSGTIVSGTGGTGTSPGWGMDGCIGAADCRAWLQSNCNPALAGRDPAVMSSIEDVVALADAATPRVLEFKAKALVLHWGRLIVQFWDDGCREMIDSRHTRNGWGSSRRKTLLIPHGARWMTITSSPDNVNIGWTLS